MRKTPDRYTTYKIYSDGIFKIAVAFVFLGLLIAMAPQMPEGVGMWMALIPFVMALAGFADIAVGVNR